MPKKQVPSLIFGGVAMPLITVYNITGQIPKTEILDHQLQQQCIANATFANTFTIDLNNQNKTYFNFLLKIKEFLNQNLNIRVAISHLWGRSRDQSSMNLMNNYIPSDNIPPLNIFFINIQQTFFSYLSNIPLALDDSHNEYNLHMVERLRRPANVYWQHPFDSSREYSNEYLRGMLLDRDDLTIQYLQGENINQPNVRLFENFIRLFYSPMNNMHIDLCPFEYIDKIWTDLQNQDGTIDIEDFIYLFIECDAIQNFKLYFTLLPVNQREIYEIQEIQNAQYDIHIDDQCNIDLDIVTILPFNEVRDLDLSGENELFTISPFERGNDYYRVITPVPNEDFTQINTTTHYFDIDAFRRWLFTPHSRLCRHPIYDVQMEQNNIKRFTYPLLVQVGNNGKRKSRSFRKKNYKKSMRR